MRLMVRSMYLSRYLPKRMIYSYHEYSILPIPRHNFASIMYDTVLKYLVPQATLIECDDGSPLIILVLFVL